MANKISVGLIQMDVLWGDPLGNIEKAKEMLNSIEDCDVAVLPELWSCSYQNERLSEHAQFTHKCLDVVANWCVDRASWSLAGSLPFSEGGALYNRAFWIDPTGTLVAYYDKVHLFPLLEEPSNFVAGNSPLITSVCGVPSGTAICYDIRFPEYIRRIALEDVWVLFVCAQWPLSRIDAWKTLVRARAIENQMFVVAVNRCGKGGGDIYGGHSTVVAPDGQVLMEMELDEGVVTVELDMAILHRTRKVMRVFDCRRKDLYGFPGEI
ncbi:putative amidohydrolase [Thermanaerovibrio velox DSM 12556]|uniref:Putative amidohydrolase n=1 Tax=Thermanaerovibrio velox DSM 12556 TaxID=926567 RepID=H0URW7_9BACT|nr:nitrilase-related carbon-nitrogen hydrolase [Thermanaerovibrio velox]EHM10056.1 putative amidohydrolase [Thermanaerovibrio velox DSM 12556]